MAVRVATTADKPKRVRKARPAAPPCANCETAMVGAFCHACGQKARLHDKLSHLVEEFAEGIAHFDGRLWRTLPLLALHPGRLSREWMAGRRVRYIAPLHLFLFAVFLLFLIPNFTGRHLFDFGDTSSEAMSNAGLWMDNPDGTRTAVDPGNVEAFKRDQGLEGPVATAVDMVIKLTKNPAYYGYKMEALAYKLSFVTVPISVAILWLMYAWRRRFSLYHHSVVSLYGLGFVALLFAFASLFPGGSATALNLLIVLIAPVHAARHLRGAYGSGWVQTILRTLVLGLLTTIAFLSFLLGVVFLGLTG
ncbi:MAG: DUF3667 domain-containing protein [Brevundimonas sp.]